tara:strand:+ start:424 stop:672 length:249 start_codon:yes stop_codon:yes gene_type:complete
MNTEQFFTLGYQVAPLIWLVSFILIRLFGRGDNYIKLQASVFCLVTAWPVTMFMLGAFIVFGAMWVYFLMLYLAFLKYNYWR